MGDNANYNPAARPPVASEMGDTDETVWQTSGVL